MMVVPAVGNCARLYCGYVLVGYQMAAAALAIIRRDVYYLARVSIIARGGAG